MTSEQQPFYIGRYKVTARLGAGGMGVVYLATDEHLARQVAIKCLRENPTSSNASQRIRQEAQLLAQLNHPNIVQIYDVVEHGDDLALVMEYVHGSTLGQWQRECSPTIRQCLALLKQICHGLSRAHGAGIIHRDLKADNILVDENSTVKITDFGIAKHWRQHSDLTREQHIAGSWSAMSPEQALGKPLDNRCDIFAVGVLAFRLLCGQNPFGDHDSPFVITDRIVNSQHPPAQKLNPDLPPALSQLIDRLLAKAPHKRPLSASAVAEELGGIMQQLAGDTGERSVSQTTSLTSTITAETFHRRQRRFGSSRSWHIGSGIAGITGAVLAGALLWNSSQPERSGEYIAIITPDETNVSTPASRQLGNNVLSALKQDLANRAGLLLVPYSESQQLAGKPLREQAEALNADLLLHPSLTCSAAQCETALELIDADNMAVIASRSTALAVDESTESRARILQQVNKLLQPYEPRSSTATFALSDVDYKRYLRIFDRRDDDAHTSQHLDELEALQQHSPAFTPLYRLFAELSIDQRYNSRDLAATERLEKFIERAPPQIIEHPDVLSARLRLAVNREDRAQAEELLKRLKLILPDRANYHYLKASSHQHLGDYDEALASADRALALRHSYSHMVQKAMALSASGQMDAARPLLLQALTMSESNIDALSLLAANALDAGHPQEALQLLGSIDPDRLGSMDLYNLCLAHYIERQFQQADQCFASLSQRSPGDAESLLYRAEIASVQRRPELAREFARQALATVAERSDWEGLLMQARAHAVLGESARAIEKLIRIGRDAPDDIYVNFARAQVYLTTGDLFSAKAHLRKTLDLGLSPIWFETSPFTPVCELQPFADLRRDYPKLCGNLRAEIQAAGRGEG
ncbi:serine/threonine-protein kinase PknD [Microbulbifer aestuariivivens]|uniref:Serine/threonine-protein kinase PknD n=1 Tax=Microbulbifer aestuariivivens TaxID=1908308 RepID=A0ABP9WNX0_9GAMM